MALTKVTYGLLSADTSAIDLNIDANTLYVDSSANRVGLGTSSPSYKLDVVGKIKSSDRVLSNVYQSTSTYGMAWKNSGGTDNMFLSNDGDLGIGTTSPDRQLEVEGQGVIRLNATGSSTDPGIDFNTASTNDMQFRYRGGTDVLAVYSYGTSSDVVSIKKADGNVGIGQTSPNAKLHVQGNIISTGVVQVFPSAAGAASVQLQRQSQGTAWSLAQGNSSVDMFEILRGSSSYLAVNSNGEVGIGTTSPSHALSVGGTTSGKKLTMYLSGTDEHYSAVGAQRGESNVYCSSEIRFINESNSAGTGAISFATGNNSITERMRINSSGLVMIGTTTASGLLNVDGNLHYGGQLRVNDASHDGTESNPSICVGYDNDNGFFRPTSNTIGMTTAGTERMRITATGNVGIGTTSPEARLDVRKTVFIGDGLTYNASSESAIEMGATNDTSVDNNKSYKFKFNVGGSASGGQNLEIATYKRTQGLGEIIRIMGSTGNVGIGTTNPTFKLDVQSSGSQVRIRETSTSGYATLRVQAAGNTHGLEIDCFGTTSGGAYGVGSGGCAIMNVNSTPLAFGTGNSTDMMIDGSGNVVVGNTSQISLGKFSVEFNGTSQNGTVLQTTRSATGSTFIRFNNSSGTAIGSIYQNAASTVLYSTSSDYRLKQNEIAVWDGTTVLKQLKPYKFNWKADPTGEAVHGFFAHELAEVIPDAVAGEKDAVDSEGRPEYQGVDQSRLVPLLVKTIQELEARITELESK